MEVLDAGSLIRKQPAIFYILAFLRTRMGNKFTLRDSPELQNMALVLRYGGYKSCCRGLDGPEILGETRLNLLALEYGYKYRLDIRPRNGYSRTEFVRTLREARFVGMRIRKSGGVVHLFKIYQEGTLTRHQW
jgi:hypothetical protein